MRGCRRHDAGVPPPRCGGAPDRFPGPLAASSRVARNESRSPRTPRGAARFPTRARASPAVRPARPSLPLPRSVACPAPDPQRVRGRGDAGGWPQRCGWALAPMRVGPRRRLWVPSTRSGYAVFVSPARRPSDAGCALPVSPGCRSNAGGALAQRPQRAGAANRSRPERETNAQIRGRRRVGA